MECLSESIRQRTEKVNWRLVVGSKYRIETFRFYYEYEFDCDNVFLDTFRFDY